jgi:hypothetical protein
MVTKQNKKSKVKFSDKEVIEKARQLNKEKNKILNIEIMDLIIEIMFMSISVVFATLSGIGLFTIFSVQSQSNPMQILFYSMFAGIIVFMYNYSACENFIKETKKDLRK